MQGSNLGVYERFFLFINASRVSVGPTVSLILWVPGFFSRWESDQNVTLSTRHLVSRLGMSGVVPLPPPPLCTFMMWKAISSPSCYSFVAWDSSVGVVTGYGPDGPGIVSPIVPTKPPVQWVLGLTWVVKRPGRGVYHPLPSSADVKSWWLPVRSFWVFRPSSGVNFTFLLLFILLSINL